MKRTSLLFILVFVHHFIDAQVRSDTSMIWVNDSLAIKTVHAFNSFGFLSYSKDGETWQVEKGIGSSDSVIRISNNLAVNPSKYTYQTTGVLKLNESVSFIIGTFGTYDYEGTILRTENAGKSWKAFIKKKDWEKARKDITPNSALRSRDLYFLNESIGIVFFGDKTVGITQNQGKTWKIQPCADHAVTYEKKSIRIDVTRDVKSKKLTGTFSVDKGKSFVDIEI